MRASEPPSRKPTRPAQPAQPAQPLPPATPATNQQQHIARDGKAPRTPAASAMDGASGGSDALATLESALGYTFTERMLLRDALTHRSYLNEHREMGLASNERMEFLGDAVAGLVSADLLYAEYPDRPEGVLSQMRSVLVKGETLAKFARALDLGSYVRLGRSEETNGGRDRWLLLGSTFEAIIGALYLDGGMPVARGLLEPYLRQELEALSAKRAIKDDKSQLQELAQGQLGITPHYVLIEQGGPAHKRTFTVAVMIGDLEAAQGTGSSKRAAEQAAAHAALDDPGWLRVDGEGDSERAPQPPTSEP